MMLNSKAGKGDEVLAGHIANWMQQDVCVRKIHQLQTSATSSTQRPSRWDATS